MLSDALRTMTNQTELDCLVLHEEVLLMPLPVM